MAITEKQKKLFKTPIQNVHIQVAVLDWSEKTVIQQVEGMATGGNINLNGNSSVRRNGTITFVVDGAGTLDKNGAEIQNFNDLNSLFSTNKKIQVKMGISSEGRAVEGEEIEWFNLGKFIIKNPSLSRNTSGITITLTISDSMCLLNGEMGGNLPAATTFSEINVQNEDGTITKEYPLVSEIISTLVNQYGNIDTEKISINDVSSTTRQVMKWGLERPLYRNARGGSKFLELNTPEGSTLEYTYNYNDIVGFVDVPFTWPGQTLTANAGETITSVLDKIKNLGDYEYFFDEDNNFIWQKKKSYVYRTGAQSFNSQEFLDGKKVVDGVTYTIADELKAQLNINDTTNNIVFDFENGEIVTSYQNAPQYNNVKNDFIVWGKRKTTSGAELPIRYRVVFNKMPSFPDTETVDCVKYKIAEPDIYGYKKCIVQQLPILPAVGVSNVIYVIDGTYYEWKEDRYIRYNEKPYETISFGGDGVYTDTMTCIYFKGISEASNYNQSPIYKDLETEWPKLYDFNTKKLREGLHGDELDYYCHIVDIPGYNVDEVGRFQTKVVNDNNVNCIYSPDIPNYVIHKTGDTYKTQEKYQVVNVSDEIYNNLYVGGSQYSAFELVRQTINQYTGYNNSISLSAIPVYGLQPNQIIKVNDTKSGIKGAFVVNSISIPLTYNGLMNISASRALVQES